MRGANPRCGSGTGRTASAAPRAAAWPRSATGATTNGRSGSATAATTAGARSDDPTGTVPVGRHRPPRVRVLRLHPTGLDLSDRRIARELDLAVSDVQAMAE